MHGTTKTQNAIREALRKECDAKGVSYLEEDTSAELCAKLNTE